jgi:Ricin-type beta-trefoil lectin domain-like
MFRTPSSRRTTRFLRMATSSAAALALAAPVAANAQSLGSVAIATNISQYSLVLDVSGGSTSAGANVIQWYGHGGANQRWNFVELPNGNERIVNQKSGMCLTTSGVAGQQLYQWYCNGDARQEWQGTLSNVFADNFFSLGSFLVNPASGLRVDISGASAQAGAAVVGWYQNGNKNQRFKYWQLG